jgi:DNA uptake protein ComE-like DNA-binding protein
VTGLFFSEKNEGTRMKPHSKRTANTALTRRAWLAAALLCGAGLAGAATAGAQAASATAPPAAASAAHPMLSPHRYAPVTQQSLKPPPRKLIDINSASKTQLKTLPGIGDAEAARIIAGRPYLTKADLVTAKAIPAGTYVSIKRSIVALQPGKPAVKGKG